MSGRYHPRSAVVPPSRLQWAARTKAAFIELRGEADAEIRASQIATLPQKTWRGQVLYQIRCHGETGKGPHDYWVSEGTLWSLIDLRAFRCPFHA